MPVMTGLDLLRRIRTTNPRVRTVMVTGAPVSASLLQAVGADVIDRLLTKPWKDSELRGVVRELLESR